MFKHKKRIVSLIFAIATQVVAVCILCSFLVLAYDASPSPETTPRVSSDAWTFLLNPDRDYKHVLVNERHPYEFDGEYDQKLQPDLVYVMDDVYYDALTDLPEPLDFTLIENQVRNSTRIEKAAYYAYTRLKADLKRRHNIDIGLLGSTAGYRNYADQQEVYDGYGGILPGYSDHHTGLTISIVFLLPSESGGADAFVPTVDFANEHPDLIGPFLAALPENGFIVRYPPGKEYSTGVPGLYREIRFVGSSDTAKLITALDISLEEFRAQTVG